MNRLGEGTVEEGVQMVNTKSIVKLAVIFLLTGCGGEPFDAQQWAGASFGGAAPVEYDAGAGGAAGSMALGSGGVEDSGITIGAGDAVGAGGTEEDAGDVVAAGGAQATEDGGSSSSAGGVSATGGAVGTGGVVACTLVTHDNGLGAHWQDCVPLGTYDEAQAMKACEVSGEKRCSVVSACGSSLPEVRGYNADNSLGGRWGYEGALAGYVGTGSSGELCFGASDPNNRRWN